MKSFFKSLGSLVLLASLTVNCASSTGIFPSVSLSNNEDSVVLPNPIDIVYDTTNNQLIVVNSNVDIYFDKGSVTLLNVNANDVTAPQLSLVSAVATPNFAGQTYFDGASNLYVPFREQDPSHADRDLFYSYTIGAGTVALNLTSNVVPDPYGITLSGGLLYVVGNDVLASYNTNLVEQTALDLTTIELAGFDNADSTSVLAVEVHAASNIAAVTNEAGRLFLVDLSSNVVRQVVDGPLSTRELAFDGNVLYVLDAGSKAVWVFDMDDLPSVSASPESVDDSKFLITTIPVGSNPQGLVVDSTNNRLYVSNTLDDSISVIDTLSYQELARVSLDKDDISSTFFRDGERPIAMTLGTVNGRQYLFVACFESSAVIMIDTVTLQVVEVFPNTAE